MLRAFLREGVVFATTISNYLSTLNAQELETVLERKYDFFAYSA